MSTGASQALAPGVTTIPPSERDANVTRPRNLFAATILLSAILLFQTELIVAKYILPWFGGAPAVWNTCMLFFQSLLLAGYAYSHWLSSHFERRQQVRIHTGVVVFALATTAVSVALWGSPLTPGPGWRYFLASDPVLHIIVVLAAGVGVPFFLLATTGPLMQRWYSLLYPGTTPYRLYAVSNVGSLLGLLGYPFLLEWLLPIRKQALLWTALFVVFLFLCGWQSRAMRLTVSSREPREAGGISVRQFALWSALAACGSVMLLATTNLVCQNISSSPFLWVIPLCIYLLSLTICFENNRWYKRRLFFCLYAIAVGMTARLLVLPKNDLDPVSQLSTYFLLLFAICMICHGELERAKPAPRFMTPYYLAIAFGGALGGLLVVLVAPQFLRGYYEFHIAVLATGALVVLISLFGRSRDLPGGQPKRLPLAARVASAVTMLAVLATSAWVIQAKTPQHESVVAQLRNFFGVKRVYDTDGIRYLEHGPIVHGGQLLAEGSQMQPILYYTAHTGVGTLLTNYRRLTGRAESGPLRIGVIGLGAGTLAAYGRTGDSMRFYEVDPQVIQLSAGSRPLFTYLQKSPAKIESVLGDARINLEAEAAAHQLQQFDVLIVDAFGGDAIPVHLLTNEAMTLYLQHLRGPDSVIAVNISNRVLDLTPVLRALSARHQLTFDHFGSFGGVDWVLLSRNEKILKSPVLYQPFDFSKDKPVLWTDDYSNLLSVLKK